MALPVPEKSLRQQQEAEPDMAFPNPDGVVAFRSRLHGAATDTEAAWALDQIGAQAETPYREVTTLVTWPDVEVSCIVPTADRAVNSAWAHKAARERLHVEPRDMLSADHSPFLSRPAELAGLLLDLAT
jgi:alpha/beta hydrolase family protein